MSYPPHSTPFFCPICILIGHCTNAPDARAQKIYSYADAEATIFTYDRALIARLDRYRKKNPEIELLREEKTGAREYRVPKSWIGIKIPRDLSTAERERIKNQGTEALKKYHRSAHAQHPSQSPEIALLDSESNGRALG